MFQNDVPAAVLCWYKANGDMVPKIIKIQAEGEEVISYPVDQILRREDKYQFGARHLDFTCHIAGQTVHLIYYVQEHRWGIRK